MQKFISLIMSLITAFSLAAEGIPYMFKPTLEIDASVSLGEISTRATGYLYGIAQSNVPDSNIIESLDISSVSQKVIGGLQHPIGDVDEVSPQLENCDYVVVYLQDCFDTWYYCHEEINNMRKNGTYDGLEFMRKRFLPQVKENVTKLSQKDYADKLVYCLYNECDNAVWFGTPNEDFTWNAFDERARSEFYAAWKETYELVKSIDPEALIGGPGYCDYDAFEIRDFLEFCQENNCLPDVMIYHELSETSSQLWDVHLNEYRSVESALGIGELPVIITEYGTMQECGAPGDMLKYMVQIEKTGTYANVAYWRLANNLCDTAADNNSPNSNWWLYRWYADMNGDLLQSKIIDIPHSDFANLIKYNRKQFCYDELTGLASLDGKKLEILCGGSDYSADVVIKKLNKTNFGNAKVNVKIECVYFEGLSGIVNKPITIKEYTDRISNGKLKIRFSEMDPTAVYHIVVTEAFEDKETYINNSLPVRYEFENGTLLGNAYTYDSAYATTGLQNGMVGGMEKIGDGVTLDFDAPKSGNYRIDFIFGNSNDGLTAADRTYTTALMTVDGNTSEICLPNTIKSEYTDKFSIEMPLSEGKHTIKIEHKKGTFVLDSMLVRPVDNNKDITLLPDSDRSIDGITSYLAVAPQDGFYELETTENAELTIDGAYGKLNGTAAVVYLRRGLNYIDIKTTNAPLKVSLTEKTGFTASCKASDLLLDGGAILNKDGYIQSMDAENGCASFTVNTPQEGSYRVTLTYSNNLEGGYHAYNVDLIESFVSVETVSGTQNVWCRSTYSWDTYKTVTFNVELEKGENNITLSNNGGYNFNGAVPVTPRIKSITVNRAVSEV